MRKIYKENRIQKLLLIITGIFLSISMYAQTGTICGTVFDTKLKEPLIGASVVIDGTTTGATTDIDGYFRIEGLQQGKYTISASYVSYQSQTIKDVPVVALQEAVVKFELSDANLQLENVVVVGRKNLESENVLMMERQKASVSVEHLGAREMSIKGISNVADGVKKLSGISLAGTGQLFVRGLGDRYSVTTMNGLVIASPNPDNKLIPLDLFPSSIVQNITVSKVFQASTFADYAGAHIDIATKENPGKDYLSISLSAGGRVNTTFDDFRYSDKSGGLRIKNLPQSIKDMSSKEFTEYSKQQNPFGGGFSTYKKQALPELNIGLSFGKTWDIGSNKLNLIGALGVSNDYETRKGSYVTTLTSQGTQLNEFTSDNYSYQTKASALVGLGYQFAGTNRIRYNFFYSRLTDDTHKTRIGFDSEGNNLEGSNSVYHLYSLINNQLDGEHMVGKWTINWNGGYGITASDEPDRRQAMFLRKDNGELALFKLNRQETMRFFGELDEKSGTGDLKLKYNFNDLNLIRFGGAYINKKRDYYSTRFFYNLNKLNPQVDNIYDTDDFLNQENIANENIVIDKNQQPKFSYFAGSEIIAAFAETDFYPAEKLLINAGIRYESSNQWVRYWKDSGQEMRAELNADDILPALNIKYTLDKSQAIRFGASRTVTRPQFIEMAPFLYQESYGSASIRGNEDLQNGYDYNFDLRYEYISGSGNMLSVTGYYKYLDSPIERVQEIAGGSAVHSFLNAGSGTALGIEAELRKTFSPEWRAGANLSWMYTQVKLPEDGVYTDKKRALQGASPYLANADITYSPTFENSNKLNLTLLYNLQGPRIHTVGINTLGNVKETVRHTLDFNAGYAFNSKLNFKFQAKNLLNSTIRFRQEIAETGKEEVVEYYKTNTAIEVGVTYNF
ncbi:TonB-dependent receptor [Massilibacteroides sp.]|uniref:TonB-dependent receptor n=1 Tax=Massilibacteroides sp. TaxID=2034766 RepID=UPI002636F17D|nr:TonB-dependent receptor [Massilibacteroides sp.]MDD4516405.1 TonB-dependent receptor [Massilibacteroides sp.]